MVRIAVTLVALILVVAGCAIGVRATSGKGERRIGTNRTGKRGPQGPERKRGGKAKGKQDAEPSTQDACLADHMKGGTLVQKDGTAVSYVRVDSKNNSLLNPRELVSEVEATARAIASIGHPFKVMHIQVPVDASVNIRHMDDVDEYYQSRIRALGAGEKSRRARRQLDARRAILANYKARAKLEAKASDKMRPETYVAVPATATDGGVETARRRADDVRAALKANGFDSRILDGREATALLLAFDGSFRSAGENLEPYSGFPVVPDVVNGRYVSETDRDGE